MKDDIDKLAATFRADQTPGDPAAIKGTVDFAVSISAATVAFYNHLIAGGLDKQTATALTGNYVTSYLGLVFGMAAAAQKPPQ